MSYNPAYGMPPPGISSQIPGAPGAPQMPPGMPPPGMPPGGPGGPGPGQPPGPMGPGAPMAGGGPPGMPPPGGNPGQLDPAMAAKQLGVGSEKLQQAKLLQQYKLADALRADAKQQLQGTQAGRVYVAPNIGNLIASGVQNYAAGRQDDLARGDLKTFQGDVASSGMANLKRMGLLKDTDQDHPQQ